MKLTSVHLTNYRGHENLTVEFQSGFNVIAGINGSGKTSVLLGICEVLTGYVNFMPLSAQYSQQSDESMVRIKSESINGRFRFEPQYPVILTASAFAFGKNFNWQISKRSPLDHPLTTGQFPGTEFSPDLRNTNSPRQDFALPIVVFYRANRQWSQPQPNDFQAATQRHARADGYTNWWDASIDSSALQSWVIAKCLERFQISSETGLTFDKIDSDELAQVNQVLSMAVENIKGLKYDLKQKSLLIEWAAPGREPTAFEHLSDGQRAVIGLVADIARRMCLLNPHLGQRVTDETPGVVLIDELDMHLHPHWQRLLTTGLQRAFPAVQFIVASHSPQVLGELRPENIILLRPGGTDHPQVSYGLTSSQILAEVMGAEARTPEVEQHLSRLFEVLGRGELEAARALLTDLRQTAPGIPELAGAEALLRRKEILGR